MTQLKTRGGRVTVLVSVVCRGSCASCSCPHVMKTWWWMLLLCDLTSVHTPSRHAFSSCLNLPIEMPICLLHMVRGILASLCSGGLPLQRSQNPVCGHPYRICRPSFFLLTPRDDTIEISVLRDQEVVGLVDLIAKRSASVLAQLQSRNLQGAERRGKVQATSSCSLETPYDFVLFVYNSAFEK